MRRLRLLRDERWSREVGHEVGSFARSLGAVSSLTEALIGDKVIYESNRDARSFLPTNRVTQTRRVSSEKII